jgi:hypothetical protein
MGWRLTDQGGGAGSEDADREALSEARRSIAGARSRLEELADRLRELSDRLGDDGGDRADSPELGPAGSTSSRDQRGPRSPF